MLTTTRARVSAWTKALFQNTVFKLSQTEGLIGSIIRLLGLDLPVPDHTTLSRRAATLEVPRPQSSFAPGLGAMPSLCICWWTARA